MYKEEYHMLQNKEDVIYEYYFPSKALALSCEEATTTKIASQRPIGVYSMLEKWIIYSN